MGFGSGTGAEEFILMFFSMPPVVVVYCHALIVEGIESAIV